MVKFRDPVRQTLAGVFGESTVDRMENQISNEDEWEVFQTGFSSIDYENDLEYHKEQMLKLVSKFESHDTVRQELIKKASGKSKLRRKPLLAQAKQRKLEARQCLQEFMAHLGAFEEKMDDLTAAKVSRIHAGADAVVDRSEAAEGITEGVQETSSVEDDARTMEADAARDRLLRESGIDSGLEDEEELARQYERQEIEDEDLELENELEELLEPEEQSEDREEARSGLDEILKE